VAVFADRVLPYAHISGSFWATRLQIWHLSVGRFGVAAGRQACKPFVALRVALGGLLSVLSLWCKGPTQAVVSTLHGRLSVSHHSVITRQLVTEGNILRGGLDCTAASHTVCPSMNTTQHPAQQKTDTREPPKQIHQKKPNTCVYLPTYQVTRESMHQK
jgi:hypothetical protein